MGTGEVGSVFHLYYAHPVGASFLSMKVDLSGQPSQAYNLIIESIFI